MGRLNELYGNIDGSEHKVGFFDLWKRVFLNHAKCDQSNYPALRPYNLYYSSNSMHSGKDTLNLFYTIDGYPSEIPIGFRDGIRR